MVTVNRKVSSKTNTQSTKTGSKTSTQSAKAISKTSILGAKVSSTVNTSSVKTSSTTSQESRQILKKPTTYVTGAAAIYTSSGSVSAYACGVTTKQSKKDPSESCMSCNRPSASYPDQFPQSKSVKADKSKKATNSTSSKPVSTAVPKKKADTKKASTTKKKSALIKEYMPSDSRNGAGKVFYRKKTTPSGAKEGASFLISLVPGVGDAKDIQEAVTGKDWVTGKKLSKTDRLTTVASAGIPIISGSSVRVAKNGIKYGNKVTKKTVKKAVRKGSSKSEKSTKVVKKALGKGTKKLDDVREKVAGKLKKSTKDIKKTDTGKKAVKESGDHVKIKESGVKKKEEAAGKVHKRETVSKGGLNSNNPQSYLQRALKNQGLENIPARMKETWVDKDYKYTVRVHEGNSTYTDAESIYRVARKSTVVDANGQGSGLEYLGTDGNWYPQSVLKEFHKDGSKNPLFNEAASRMTHIPVGGN